jgi:hypothetical protein
LGEFENWTICDIGVQTQVGIAGEGEGVEVGVGNGLGSAAGVGLVGNSLLQATGTTQIKMNNELIRSFFISRLVLLMFKFYRCFTKILFPLTYKT